MRTAALLAGPRRRGLGAARRRPPRRRYPPAPTSASTKPAAWAESSPRTYLSRITEPVLIHHGTADTSCPIDWSRATLAAMQQAGTSVELAVYPGQPHVFTSQWTASVERSADFLKRYLA